MLSGYPHAWNSSSRRMVHALHNTWPRLWPVGSSARSRLSVKGRCLGLCRKPLPLPLSPEPLRSPLRPGPEGCLLPQGLPSLLPSPCHRSSLRSPLRSPHSRCPSGRGPLPDGGSPRPPPPPLSDILLVLVYTTFLGPSRVPRHVGIALRLRQDVWTPVCVTAETLSEAEAETLKRPFLSEFVFSAACSSLPLLPCSWLDFSRVVRHYNAATHIFRSLSRKPFK